MNYYVGQYLKHTGSQVSFESDEFIRISSLEDNGDVYVERGSGGWRRDDDIPKKYKPKLNNKYGFLFERSLDEDFTPIKVAYAAPTKEAWNEIVSELLSYGHEWPGADKTKKNTRLWNKYRENSVITMDIPGTVKIVFGDRKAEANEKNGYKIIEWEGKPYVPGTITPMDSEDLTTIKLSDSALNDAVDLYIQDMMKWYVFSKEPDQEWERVSSGWNPTPKSIIHKQTFMQSIIRKAKKTKAQKAMEYFDIINECGELLERGQNEVTQYIFDNGTFDQKDFEKKMIEAWEEATK